MSQLISNYNLIVDINDKVVKLKNKQVDFVIKTLENLKQLSTARKAKVSAVLCNISQNYNINILATAYNGTPAGYDNNCEYNCPNCNGNGCTECNNTGLKTKTSVLHAEQNLITFCARNGISTDEKILFVSRRPCEQCIKLIISSGIKNVFFIEDHTDDKWDIGLSRLVNCRKIEAIK